MTNKIRYLEKQSVTIRYPFMRFSWFYMSTLLIIIFTAAGFAQPSDRYSTFSSQELINCLLGQGKEDSVCKDTLQVFQELLHREPLDLLLHTFDALPDDRDQLDHMCELFSQIKDSSFALLIHKRLIHSPTLQNYEYAKYLLDKGDTNMLPILNAQYWNWQISSMEKASLVDDFGKHKYRPAIKNLIESLDAASGNLSQAAYENLQKFFPSSPRFGDLDKAKKYFRNLEY